MRTVTALDVRKHLGELLDAASAGERILIERDHRPMAVLISVEEAERLGESREERVKRVDAALERLTALAREMAQHRPPDAPDAVESIRLDREERMEQVLRAARGGRDDT